MPFQDAGKESARSITNGAPPPVQFRFTFVPLREIWFISAFVNSAAVDAYARAQELEAGLAALPGTPPAGDKGARTRGRTFQLTLGGDDARRTVAVVSSGPTAACRCSLV